MRGAERKIASGPTLIKLKSLKGLLISDTTGIVVMGVAVVIGFVVTLF